MRLEPTVIYVTLIWSNRWRYYDETEIQCAAHHFYLLTPWAARQVT